MILITGATGTAGSESSNGFPQQVNALPHSGAQQAEGRAAGRTRRRKEILGNRRHSTARSKELIERCCFRRPIPNRLSCKATSSERRNGQA